MSKRSSKPILYVFLLMSLFTAGCGRVNPRQARTTIPQKTMGVLTVQQPTATSAPSETQRLARTPPPTPTPSVTPTSQPTLTPLHTLPAAQVEASVSELFTINESCQPPCWGGITPGSTTWEEAKDLLNRFGQHFETWDYPGGLAGYVMLPVPTHSVSQKIATSGQMGVTLYVSEDIVQQIVIEDPANFPDYTLPALLTRYGFPAEVLISTTNRGSAITLFSLILFYPEHGLMATYLDLTEVKDDELMGCFHYTPGPVLHFYPALEKASFAQVYETLTTGSADEYKPLQEVTALDISMFTERLKDSDYPCVETPATYWPVR